MAVSIRRRIARRAMRGILSPMLRWTRLNNLQPGYSIILGVPWDLRHLLAVNLRFIARNDLSGVRKIHVIFDRTPRPGSQEIIAAAQEQFSTLPLAFHFYPRFTGAIIERIGISTWFNSMNCVTALKAIDTQYAVLHDFDLYPLAADYFAEVARTLRERQLHFCGLEYTTFDGLREDDRILGTWCLGMDVKWLRENWQPIDVFQRVARLGSRLIQLDPFSYIQSRTEARDLVKTVSGEDVCHVGNLVGTYVRYKIGRKPDFVWRLHYMWYLESLCGAGSRLAEVISAMRQAQSGILCIGEIQTDFSRTHVTCANVLRDELTRMEETLFGRCRPEVEEYLVAFDAFLQRFGRSTSTDPVHSLQTPGAVVAASL